jgi:hypothetical protein
LEKKDGNILMDSAASYVSRTVTPFETDIPVVRETVLQNQKENFQSLPLECVFSCFDKLFSMV